MSSYFKDASCLQNKITSEDTKKIEKIFETIEKDPQAYDFLEPVDYVRFNLPDYPKIITHPMDLGTAKKKLLNADYVTFQDFIDDINLIWSNCRTYNLPTSEIVKMANHCEKNFKKSFERAFRNYGAKPEGKPINSLTYQEKVKFTEKIRTLNNEALTQVVKTLQKECAKAVEDVDAEKIQIKVDLIPKKTYESLMESFKAGESKEQNSDKKGKIED